MIMKSPTDEQIHRAVLQELAREERVEHTEVGVQVEAGVVTLTGIVSSFEKKLAACAAAHRARNVLDVANNLQVRDLGYTGISDTEIARAVRTLLRGLPISEQSIHTTVAHGMVSLHGTIPTANDLARVISAIRDVEGVLVVVNMISTGDPADRSRSAGDAGAGPGRAAVAA
jgi:osmotically-inducible protein OsmY